MKQTTQATGPVAMFITMLHTETWPKRKKKEEMGKNEQKEQAEQKGKEEQDEMDEDDENTDEVNQKGENEEKVKETAKKDDRNVATNAKEWVQKQDKDKDIEKHTRKMKMESAKLRHWVPGNMSIVCFCEHINFSCACNCPTHPPHFLTKENRIKPGGSH